MPDARKVDSEMSQRNAIQLYNFRNMLWRATAVALLFRAAGFGQSEPELEKIQRLSQEWKLAEADERAHKLLETLDPGSAAYADLLNTLAAVELRESKPIPAILDLAQRALEVKTKLLGPEAPELSPIWNTLGAVHYAASDYKTAATDYETSLKLKPDDIEARSGLGQVLAALQQMDRSISIQEEAVRLSEERFGKEDRRTGVAVASLGVPLRISGKYEQSEQAYTRAIQIFSKMPAGGEMYIADAKQGLASTYRELGQPQRALPLFVDALRTMETVLGPSHRKLIGLLNNTGLAANATGENTQAMTYFHRAIELSSSNGLTETSIGATLRGNYGIVLRGSGRLAEARQQYEAALAIQEKVLGRKHALVASILYSLAALSGDLGDLEAQRVYLERACPIDRKVLGAANAKTLECDAAYAINLSDQKRFAEARSLAQSTLETSEKVLGDDTVTTREALHAAATVERSEGRYQDAARLYTRLIENRERAVNHGGFTVAEEYFELGLVQQHLRENQVALVSLEKAERIWTEFFGSDYRRKAEVLAAKAEVLLALGRREEALTVALASVDEQRQRSLELFSGLAEREALLLSAKDVDGWDLAFEIASDGHGERREITDVWDRLIRSRSSVLDTMSERSRLANANGEGPLGEKARAVSQAREELARAVLSRPAGKIAATEETLRLARMRLEAAERELGRASTSFEQTRKERIAGFRETAKALPPGTALVAYAQSQTTAQFGVFVLRGGRNAPSLIKLANAAAISRAVNAWRKTIDGEAGSFGRRSLERDAAYRAAGIALRKAVWDPVLPLIAGVKRVYLVAAGPLQFINFETLPVGADSYLAESSFELRNLQTERDLTIRPVKRENGSLLVVANPAYSAERGARSSCSVGEFEPLAGSEAEASSVRASWRAGLGKVTELEGAFATKPAIRDAASGKRVLHFATHGFFLGGTCKSSPGFSENPLLRSGLVLAGGRENGILTAEEAASWNLDGTELVVLSGCETGSGVLHLGEGVLGFRRAFRIAGAANLVSSLWPVQDRETQAWMTAFYRAFSTGMGVQGSARRAMLVRLRERRKAGMSTNPFYWGAFLAVGTS